MEEISQNNRRIAKNTVALYVRMLVLMLISLYTSRVILATLGIEDYGIYNVVGGVVMLFSFLNSSMAGTTQRFLNVELGKNDEERAAKVFSMGLNCQFIIMLFFLVLAETIGLWYMNTYVKVPDGRVEAAHWVYQLSIIASCINIFYAPYNGAIIAYEKMGVYAYVSIVEALLKLGIVFLLVIGSSDKLILYAVLTLVVTIITAGIYVVYCLKKFRICHYVHFWEKDLFKSLMSFSGWSIFGNVANLGITQGLNLVQNFFFGVTINAAMGVATQVNGAISRFISGFTTAFSPQITKSYASGEREYFLSLVYRTTRFSFFLFFILALPIFLCCSEIMSIWLKEVPVFAVSFCRLMIIYSAIDSVCLSLAGAVGAHGDIKNYQIGLSILKILVIPASVVGLHLGASPEFVLVVNIIMNVATYVFRLFYLKSRISFDIWNFVREALVPCVWVLLTSVPISYMVYVFTKNLGLWGTLISLTFTVISVGICTLYMGMTKSERNRVIMFINRKIGSSRIHKEY